MQRGLLCVCVSVYLLDTLASPAKSAEPTEMSFGCRQIVHSVVVQLEGTELGHAQAACSWSTYSTYSTLFATGSSDAASRSRYCIATCFIPPQSAHLSLRSRDYARFMTFGLATCVTCLPTINPAGSPVQHDR